MRTRSIVSTTRFQSHATAKGIDSSFDAFAALFPHRFDFIWAHHSSPGETVQWQTERRYPLSDRVLGQGSYFYGVRFGTQTDYCLFDIDAGSLYHPDHDPFAISRLLEALEPLGLLNYVACTSSYSGGLHLYFPFETPQSSWQLAIAVSVLLENAGFSLKPGQLEVFPNPKPYQPDGKFSLFNAHRLPMQAGSYLLNTAFEPIRSTRSRFVEAWQMARSHNAIEAQIIRCILKQAKRQSFRLSGKADQFLNDLNAEIEMGWTGSGQTNWLLGRITMREYVFRHVLSGGTPLTGAALIEAIVEVARSLPGYSEFCNHQHEIEHRAAEWARCIESSHYFHYGDACGRYKAQSQEVVDAIEAAPTWNQQQSGSAREKIRRAIADLLEKDALPSAATQRFKVLLQYKIGGGSLYRHRDLWHPQYLSLESSNVAEQEPNNVKNQPDCTPSLLSGNGGNPAFSLDSGDRTPIDEPDSTINHLAHSVESCPPAGLDAQTWQAVSQTADQIAQERFKDASNDLPATRMRQFLESGDPILIAEAQSSMKLYSKLSSSP